MLYSFLNPVWFFTLGPCFTYYCVFLSQLDFHLMWLNDASRENSFNNIFTMFYLLCSYFICVLIFWYCLNVWMVLLTHYVWFVIRIIEALVHFMVTNKWTLVLLTELICLATLLANKCVQIIDSIFLLMVQRPWSWVRRVIAFSFSLCIWIDLEQDVYSVIYSHGFGCIKSPGISIKWQNNDWILVVFLAMFKIPSFNF